MSEDTLFTTRDLPVTAVDRQIIEDLSVAAYKWNRGGEIARRASDFVYFVSDRDDGARRERDVLLMTAWVYRKELPGETQMLIAMKGLGDNARLDDTITIVADKWTPDDRN